MAGRPPSEKTFSNMLRVAIKQAHDEDKNGNRRDKLRAVAEALVEKAITGDVPAIREVADRLEGKVPQAIVGDGEHDPISLRHELDAAKFTSAIASLVKRAAEDGGAEQP